MASQLSPTIANDRLATYFITATGISSGVQFSNGAIALSGDIPRDIVPTQSIGFGQPGYAAFVYVDNQTPCTVTLPEIGALIGPFQIGMGIIVSPAVDIIHVQAQLTAVFALGASYNLVLRYSKDAGINQGGAATNTAVLAILTDGDANIYSAFSRSQGAGNGQPNPLYTIGGYSPDAPDESWYSPARTPNVWIRYGVAGFPINGSTTALYTAPAGKYWTLLCMNICEADMAVAPTNAFAHLLEGATVIYERLTFPNSATPLEVSTGQINLPGNGIKAANTGSTLNITTYNDKSTYTLVLTIGLFVGN